ncbi:MULTISPECIES: tRNA (adenosine(37)-N6)-threonylcarbamoyltransferase complex ATPase subunit type 1 TsaE [Reichenbachiella]|uniref:tRNA threonylcarbamoyladenosine biosynthesis protein TsaE n=1 Tax=Reichenbachiella agariperforans TaxID=156994 RepID=A0A1M6QF50_REIAG|nr:MULTISPECIES: tRNA (adenosine(37)-N6)-threonylcarbamoyltransferase complex ATPase subunit type 1 TsaE [Reichenbachiella]RJE73066.1 tRNA (adenosine(37)-N6)-threonylcarbamoyltransferase complex ATPase subunit type 1 TsaE [Reichenbachiella sp. MSK19-1]SHK18798.1 tRNA threonylcarbamoyladenosine biosynthesis protein TsaE [Reichenbachiella agariperforans]
MELKLSSLDEISEVAAAVIAYAGDRRVWLFEGQMGAGKTTLIKAICEQLGIIDETSSPTFSLVNVYVDAAGEEYYHFDFYRLNKEEEALDIGCDEYFYSGNHCFLEWSEKIPSLIPTQNLKININLNADTTRTISLSKDD